jgi:hypothetical protein
MAIVNKLGKQFAGLVEHSPLEYQKSGDVRRISIIDPDLPDYADIRPVTHTITDDVTGETRDARSKQTYFDQIERKTYRSESGRKLKNPRTEVTPGATRGTAAFLDYTDHGPEYGNTIDIHYMKTHGSYSDQGLARQAVETLYQQNPKSTIHWGKLMQKQTEHLYNDFAKRYPEQTGTAKFGFAG